jgi:hypothetical protein
VLLLTISFLPGGGHAVRPIPHTRGTGGASTGCAISIGSKIEVGAIHNGDRLYSSIKEEDVKKTKLIK